MDYKNKENIGYLKLNKFLIKVFIIACKIILKSNERRFHSWQASNY